ncbi:hypothetical protein LCGC14_2320520 [marine sediment metagenome]|uniref:Uncharacterized protein n=1 Tax=marine sediment metagenome TaxID=412755 RepID=A0A0F9FCS8_9ZZZZ
MTVKEAMNFLKGLDQDLPLILYQDEPTFGDCPVDVDLNLVVLNQPDAEMLGREVGQKAVVVY